MEPKTTNVIKFFRHHLSHIDLKRKDIIKDVTVSLTHERELLSQLKGFHGGTLNKGSVILLVEPCYI